MRSLSQFILVIIPLLALSACDTVSSNDPEPEPLETTLVENLAADPTERDPETGEALDQTNRYTLFSLRDNRIVLSHADPDRSDSSSTSWDIGFRGTTLIANGRGSGPGDGGLQLLDGLFEEINRAPSDGYEVENSSWFSYDMSTHIIRPTPGRVLVVRTADGRYAKIRIISYYKDAPDNPSFMDPSRYFTFEYVFQPDGSSDFPEAE